MGIELENYSDISKDIVRCDVYKNSWCIGWMVYFKGKDTIVYFNDVAQSYTKDKNTAIELFKEWLIERVLLEE